MSTPLEGEPPAAAPQATIPLPPPEALAFARHLAAVLGETEEKPIIQIARVVATLGTDTAKVLSEEALKVAAGEGILTKDKTTGELRKRTPGGTFFALVRQEVGEKAWRKQIKPVLSPKKALAVNLEQQYAVIREAASRQNVKAGDTSKVELTSATRLPETDESRGKGSGPAKQGRQLMIRCWAQFPTLLVMEEQRPLSVATGHQSEKQGEMGPNSKPFAVQPLASYYG